VNQFRSYNYELTRNYRGEIGMARREREREREREKGRHQEIQGDITYREFHENAPRQIYRDRAFTPEEKFSPPEFQGKNTEQLAERCGFS
jgi:hypothetical protein